ncbi:NAD-dependent epimerase/dehydratase family protein [Actinopolyspora mortivallis]|uniref:NAD-dependent epimerase/dehydratase family protein n=1 Tax=Actinopolyspora mortivallis TaxID=33906 RepID=UPI0003A982FC|nr:NAD(P)-dependent oxidoreductase [Actinopolyspora mortivallis]
MADTAVVFGANGFIGRWISRALVLDGWRCVDLDRRGRAGGAARDVEAPYYDGGNWSEVTLTRFLEQFGSVVVINAAGAAWSTDAPTVLRDNITWARRLGIACEMSESVAEIVHIGSAHEYGELPEGVAVRESDPLTPDSTYASSKSAGASYLVRAAYGRDVPIRIVRPFNVVGPGHGSQGLWASAVELYRNALAESSEQVVASVPRPETTRDFVDVRDVARLVTLTLGRPDLPLASVYNAGSGEATTIRELFDVFREETGIDYQFSSTTMSLRPGSRWQCADIAKAESELGWRREFSLLGSVRASLVLYGKQEDAVFPGKP